MRYPGPRAPKPKQVDLLEAASLVVVGEDDLESVPSSVGTLSTKVLGFEVDQINQRASLHSVDTLQREDVKRKAIMSYRATDQFQQFKLALQQRDEENERNGTFIVVSKEPQRIYEEQKKQKALEEKREQRRKVLKKTGRVFILLVFLVIGSVGLAMFLVMDSDGADVSAEQGANNSGSFPPSIAAPTSNPTQFPTQNPTFYPTTEEEGIIARLEELCSKQPLVDADGDARLNAGICISSTQYARCSNRSVVLENDTPILECSDRPGALNNCPCPVFTMVLDSRPCEGDAQADIVNCDVVNITPSL
eukprot:maker-scaffold_63-snap-gene-0.7-mRNA-1 protein AED:0.02 eAED:0.02 QI:209/1/1/1/0.5/0.33/3/103/305